MIKPATFNKMCILGQRTPVGYREGSSLWYRGLSQATFSWARHLFVESINNFYYKLLQLNHRTLKMA